MGPANWPARMLRHTVAPTLPTRLDAPITAIEVGSSSRSRWRMLMSGDRVQQEGLEDESAVVIARRVAVELRRQRRSGVAAQRDAVVDRHARLVAHLPDDSRCHALALDGIVEAAEHAGGVPDLLHRVGFRQARPDVSDMRAQFGGGATEQGGIGI